MVAAEEAIRTVLASQEAGDPAVIVRSPPGAGKTTLIRDTAVYVGEVLGERCLVATPNNAQAWDVVERISSTYPGVRVGLLHSDEAPPPPHLRLLDAVTVTSDEGKLPADLSVVVATVSKWAWNQREGDVLMLDEAYQVKDAAFFQIAARATRMLLVGDPGQIDPITKVPVERWAGSPTGPHVPCPEAFLARHPETPVVSLPISRRLPPDSAQIIQRAFYRDLPFTSEALPGDRALRVTGLGLGPLDAAIGCLVRGVSIVEIELPDAVCPSEDAELAAVIAATVRRLLDLGATVIDAGVERLLIPEMIGVVCSHHVQVADVARRLGRDLSKVRVDTADRFQGLERHVMLVHHPLSGRRDVDVFHADRGRLCVMASRHRVACLILSRSGVAERLESAGARSDRVLGSDRNPAHEGRSAHIRLLQELREREQVFSVRTK